jgi:hypothetical protein
MTLTFTHLNQTITGILKPVSGASAVMYHFYVDGYYRGQLWKTADGWQWDSREFPGIRDEVVRAMEAAQ